MPKADHAVASRQPQREFGSWPHLLLSLILCSYACLVLTENFQHSPAWDELGHLPAGILHWRYGDFRPYAVNPPLVRLIAALPVLYTPAARGLVPHSGDRPEWDAAYDLIKLAGEDLFGLYHAARCALMPVLLLGPVSLYMLGARYWGARVGLAAAAMYCFSPTVLAYSALLVPDACAAAFAATTVLVACVPIPRRLRSFPTGLTQWAAQPVQTTGRTRLGSSKTIRPTAQLPPRRTMPTQQTQPILSDKRRARGARSPIFPD